MVVSRVVSTDLNRNCEVLVRAWSDSSCSPVEGEPLLDVLWCVVSDSKSILVGSNMLFHEQSPVGLHHGLDLELDSIFQWVSWEFDSLSVWVPLLMGLSDTWLKGHQLSVSVSLRSY